ncbi:MAG: hypothetical protein WA213_12240 [Terriglobales bacterium]
MKKRKYRLFSGLIAMLLVTGLPRALAQSEAASQPPAQASTYQPKFPGDPARSESEAVALGYMRVVLRAERAYKKRHAKYALTLAELAGTASFTKRMAQSTTQGDYTVGFRRHRERNSDEEGFVLIMTPAHMDADHRSFYAEEDGVIHGDDQKAADRDSPKVSER